MPVPERADKFDADTLNPLLNPLLASHMGRWAEVYFTNPPEKREQAVSELLRELEQVADPPSPSVQGVNGTSAKESSDTVDSLASGSEVVHICGVCAYNNSAGHSFCGMCGAPLQIAPETEAPRVEESAAIAGASWYERSHDPKSLEERIEPAVSSSAARESSDALEASWQQIEKETELRHLGARPEPPPHRYRLYIGAVLAVILAAFGFGLWRGTEARSGASASSSTVASPNAQQAPIRSAQPAGGAATALPPESQPASGVQNQQQAVASSAEGQAVDSQIPPQTAPQITSQITHVPSSSSGVPAGAVATGQGGAGELAIAEEYLNGTSGMTRDSREAAQWLWKAVGKRNVEATLALSDLYFRGDGVPKNCDQARLLLDAAARKGAPAAAERLRKLETSNCD
jgi:hypothetical protein